MTTFQPGQKVRYIGERLFDDDPSHGVVGTVVEISDGRRLAVYHIDFGSVAFSAYASELEAAS